MVSDHTYLTWSTYSNPREVPTDLDISHYSWEKGLATQSTSRQLTDPRVHTQLLSWASQWSRWRKTSSCQWLTTMLTGPISEYVQRPLCNIYRNGWRITQGTQLERWVSPLESRSYNKSYPSPKAYCFAKTSERKHPLIFNSPLDLSK
jgi:hypothetical protein